MKIRTMALILKEMSKDMKENGQRKNTYTEKVKKELAVLFIKGSLPI